MTDYCSELKCWKEAEGLHTRCREHIPPGFSLLQTFYKGQVNQLRWDLCPKQITELTEALILWGRGQYDKCAQLGGAPGLLRIMADADTFIDTVSSCLTFPKETSPDQATRDAATEASKALSKFNVECSMRYDVYLAVQSFDGSTLVGEDKRFLERLLRDYRRSGMHLDESTRAKVKAIEERMSDLSTNYSQILNEENASFEMRAEDLVGMPEDWLTAREKKGEDGQLVSPKVYCVTLKYPDFNPINTLCKVPVTRQKMEHAFNSRGVPANVKILEELVALRQQHADLLGFPTHAHYMLDARMAKRPETVVPFLEDLNTKLTPLWDKEKDVLLRYKREECGVLQLEFDGKLNAWDMAYYMNIVQQQDFKVDHEALKPYFPLEHVTKELLAIYQELLGLRFQEVANANAWHPEVRLFEVYNTAASERKDGPLIGMFYLDMHPRQGKYGHAAVWGLQRGCEIDGARQLPVAAGVMNFSKATPNKPSLLAHEEVVTFFHEFGHAMHQMCALAKYNLFAGTSVERDFVEAPSQMLENWCWCEEGLSRLSSHYETKKPLPTDLIQNLVRSKVAGAGYSNKRQLVYGLFDQSIHAIGLANTAKIFQDVQRKVLPELELTPGTNKAGSFGHLAGGYHAQYYGYMWSDVFSADMFECFKQQGIFNPTIGGQYRKCILEPGGSRDASDMLRDFLGRDPVPEPFLRSLGL